MDWNEKRRRQLRVTHGAIDLFFSFCSRSPSFPVGLICRPWRAGTIGGWTWGWRRSRAAKRDGKPESGPCDSAREYLSGEVYDGDNNRWTRRNQHPPRVPRLLYAADVQIVFATARRVKKTATGGRKRVTRLTIYIYMSIYAVVTHTFAKQTFFFFCLFCVIHWECFSSLVNYRFQRLLT